MQLPHNAAVLVADGRKLLFLRNEGDDTHPNLTVEHAEEQANPKDSDQKSDAPGVSYSSFGSGRNTMEEVDFHQLEEDRFAADAAKLLERRALAGDFDSLIVIAPPHTLGELRKHYHAAVSALLKGELAKDLTKHTVADIEAAIKAA